MDEEDLVASLTGLVTEFRFLADLHVNDYFAGQVWPAVDARFPGIEAALPDLHSVALCPSSPPRECARACPALGDFLGRIQSLAHSADGPRRPFAPGKGLKKRHEVDSLARLVSRMAAEAGVHYLVDFGAGRCSLANALSKRGFRVVAVDQSGANLQGGSPDLLKAATRITRDWRLDDLVSLHPELKGQPLLLYSLHACGSLSDRMLLSFVHEPAARAVVNVGCCYNLMGRFSADDDYYPMSGRLGRAAFSLTTNMKMIACQSPARWAPMAEETVGSFRRHFYRALFEKVRRDRAADCGKLSLGTMPKRCFASWGAYLAEAAARAGLGETGCYQHYGQEHAADLRRIAIFWLLRSLLGPAIERIILLDRVSMLRELGHPASLDQVFDSIASPRCLAIVSAKDRDAL